MSFNEWNLIGNGIAYFALFLGYTATNARYEHRIWGAQLAGFVSLVFSILFFARVGIGYNPDNIVATLFRVGVYLFVLGNLAALRTLTTPDHRIDV